MVAGARTGSAQEYSLIAVTEVSTVTTAEHPWQGQITPVIEQQPEATAVPGATVINDTSQGVPVRIEPPVKVVCEVYCPIDNLTNVAKDSPINAG